MTARRIFTRYLALPVVSAGILGGAALGLAGMANAGTYSYQPEPRPGIVAKPSTLAPPAITLMPRHGYYYGNPFAFGNPSAP
jgi:hypothetical protein